MDLYGSGASIGQANALTQQAREINIATNDFNNSLAEQLDQAKTAENEEQTDITSKNMLSVGTAGGKLLASAEARGDVLDIAKKVKSGFKEIPVSFKEKMESAGVKTEQSPAELQESIEATYQGGARPPSPTGLGRAGAPVESSAQLGEGAGEEGSRLVGRGFRYGTVESAADIPKSFAERIGVKGAEELGTTGFIKTGIAGVGGALDIAKDIERGNFGSNSLQKVGNIANIIGSGLEVAGIATAWNPFGIGLEGLGAVTSLVGAGLETVGDIEEGSKESEKTESDIKSQVRGQTVAQGITQAVGRTQ